MHTDCTWKQRIKELYDPKGRFMVSAHRGFWTCPQGYPENSLAALDAACQAGADIIEIDIHKTLDGVLVLSHDHQLTRTTNIRQAWEDGLLGEGEPVYRIDQLTYPQLQKLRLRSGDGGEGAPLTDMTIPTLEEAVRLCRRRIFLLLDRGWPMRREICSILQRLDGFDSCIFQTGGPLPEVSREILALKAEFGDAPHLNWFCYGKTPEDAAQMANALSRSPVQPAMVQPHTDRLVWEAVVDRSYDFTEAVDTRLLNAILPHSRIMLGTYDDWGNRLGFAMDDPGIWQRLLDAGYRTIQTDKPIQCLEYARKTGLR